MKTFQLSICVFSNPLVYSLQLHIFASDT